MDRAELEGAVGAGRTFEYLFFWGHRPARPGAIDASCLSQWYPAPLVVDGVRYPTAEHWMMASKARLFGDEDALERILATSDPGKAKALGRGVRGFDEEIWITRRFELVVAGNDAKFSQDAALARYLLATGERVLVEASPRDRIWGIGLGRDDARANDPCTWRGENLLGFALVEVRARLRARR